LNILLATAFIALAAFPFVGTDYYLQMVTRMMILAIFAMSLDCFKV
jgi:branched-chain amino acid transport system permease protein